MSGEGHASEPSAASGAGPGGVRQLLRRAARRAGLRRTQVASARMCCERNLIAALGARARPRTTRQPTRTTGRIFCYHAVGQPLWGVNDVSPGRFRRHIELALARGYRFVPAAEIARTGGGPKDLAITFDDGLKSVLTGAAPILAEYDIPWSLFVVSAWADGRHAWGEDVFLNWAEIERLAVDGAEIGSHSVSHPNFAWIDAAQTVDELARSRDTIERRTGLVPASFAIPLGQSENWPTIAAQTVAQAGYTTVYAQSEARRPAGTVPRTFVSCWDNDRVFRALLRGAFDRWEEWV